MNMRFIFLALIVVAAAGCQCHRLTQQSSTKEAVQRTASTTVLILPGTPMTVPLPGGSSTLREVVAKARSMNSEEEFLRYISTDAASFGVSEASPALSVSAGNVIVLVRGKDRFFIPSALAFESILGDYPVNSQSVLISMPETDIRTGKFWIGEKHPLPPLVSVQCTHNGEQVSVSVPPDLDECIGSIKVNQVAFVTNLNMSKANVAVIHRELDGFHDHLILPLQDNEFGANCFVPLLLAQGFGSFRLLDGDVVELSRLELLPVTAIAISGIR